ncbi:glucokinase [Geitlerinema splendidum]|nr:glucokinase [Geitlerinema splendidum]
MTLLLAGDIGGTKTFLRLVEASEKTGGLHTLNQAAYSSQEFPDLIPMIRQFLAASAQTGEQPQPEKACLAIAGPIVKDTAKLTNLPWLLDARHLEQELSIPHVRLINDFAAVGYGILGLSEQDIFTLQPGQPDPNAPIAVIGAGTGLGEGFLIRLSEDRYQVFSSEGGHADFAPRNELEFELLKYLRDRNSLSHISVERVVSGQGVIAIYQFLRDKQIAPESPEIGQIVRTWEQQLGQEKTVDPAAAISIAAIAKRDRLSERTMQLFIETYGAEAGNLAIKLLPYGGLYIAGGIAAKNLDLMKQGEFLQAFLDKGRVSPLLEKVPVHIILNQQVGLIGSAISLTSQ